MFLCYFKFIVLDNALSCHVRARLLDYLFQISRPRVDVRFFVSLLEA